MSVAFPLPLLGKLEWRQCIGAVGLRGGDPRTVVQINHLLAPPRFLDEFRTGRREPLALVLHVSRSEPFCRLNDCLIRQASA